MNKKTILIIVISLAVGVLIGLGLHKTEYLSGAATTSPAGTTFSTQRLAEIVFVPATATATTTSILNTDSNDRIIESSGYYCAGLGTSFTAYSGGGLASLAFTAATTSTSAPTSLSALNTNYVLNTNVATSTVDGYSNASTTLAAATRVWAAGSYLTFSSNATNTATCVVWSKYIAQ